MDAQEVLRLVILYLHPKDLPTLAAANRHLRGAVAASIDRRLAQYHISQTRLEHIPFDHPLFRFHHTVAALCRYGIQGEVAEQIWGALKTDGDSQKFKELLPDRVRAVRAAVQRRFRTAEPNQGQFDLDLDEEMRAFTDAIEMARCLESLDLLRDIRSLLPEAILEDLESIAMRRFFLGSLELGYAEGLKMMPRSHSFLERPSADVFLLHALASREVASIQFLLKNGATPSKSATRFLNFQTDHDMKILLLLLRNGFDANWPLLESEVFLSIVENDHYKFLEVLLEYGANPNTLDEKGVSVIQRATALEDVFGDNVAVLSTGGGSGTGGTISGSTAVTVRAAPLEQIAVPLLRQ
ncbi:hypothetical protein HDU96_001269 [Phlyctochytrium bullatum]|nr:hypothetical protein HDU96_001269 [Phlyctochytrium bullatum]